MELTKKTDYATELGEELDQKHWRKLSAQHTDEALVATFRAATGEAETRVGALTGVSHADFRRLVFDRAKSMLIEQLKRDPALRPDLRDQMAERLARVRLYTVAQYIDAMVAYDLKRGYSSPEPTLRANAYRRYMASCGRNGLSPNAFYDEADGIPFVVACAGLLLEPHDYGGSRQDVLDAAIFTIGHELGHAIDSSSYPQAYSEMAGCFRTITGSTRVWDPGISDEISADHWGATVLAEALRTRPGGPPAPEEVAKVIAYASNAMSDEWADDSPHPPAVFRVNQAIARHPALNQLLRCPDPGLPNPTCTLRGIAPEGWRH
ncbi:MAG: hypothetical protein K2X07_13105 [Caulobacteraceae bacterium]|nr:hypothetical protein [Caulobacteraceae bacterium]